MAFSWKQVKAIIIRRLIMHKRGKTVLIGSVIPILLFLVLSIILEYTVEVKDDFDPVASSFKFYRQTNPSYVMVYSDTIKDLPIVKKIEQTTSDLIKEDIGTDPKLYRFQSVEEMNENIYELMSNDSKDSLNVLIGLAIADDVTDDYLPITLVYNNTRYPGNPGDTASIEQLHRIIWKATQNKKFTARSVVIQSKAMTQLTGRMTPMFTYFGLFALSNLFSRNIVDDIKRQKRPYMQTCKLSLWAYWIGCFVVDYALWVIVSFIEWIVLFAISSPAFKNQPFASFWAFIVSGIPITLLTYIFSFMFDNPTTAASYVMYILFIPLMIVFLIEMFREPGSETVFTWLYACYPVTATYQFITSLIDCKLSFGQMWTDKYLMPQLVMMIVWIPICIGIIALIEWARVKIAKKKTSVDYNSYTAFLQAEKEKKNVTEESIQMERDIDNSSPSDYAIRVKHVTRLFFDSKKMPVAAVNDVSLGVKRGELFGFLGANGAGKTTLMNMIVSKIPTSNGVIEINGENIEKESEHYAISICPQFNDNLTNELTPIETIKFFGRIFNLEDEEIDNFINEYIPLLELEEHKDKTIAELSGGNARKLAVLLAFLSPADIILLDEPTSSLDPVARHKVHELINKFRDQKTFMLCTHLLDEAESLCDNISMMINGCIYTVGSPQYLSSRFGTEWKVDLLLDSENDAENVMNFFSEKFPASKLTTTRPNNLIYAIPADSCPVVDIFKTIKQAIDDKIGIKYFTCSSSSLEKVFLELILRADEEVVEESAPTQEVITNP